MPEFHADEIDLAPIDFHMPGLDGLQLGVQLRILMPEARQVPGAPNAQEALLRRA